MTSITQITSPEQEADNTITGFFKTYHVGKLLRTCNASKVKGVPIIQIFKYLISVIFADRSMYMQMQTGTYKEDYGKNTIYRFLSNPSINWQKFTTLLSASLVKHFFTDLTSEKRRDVFIIDDSLFDRSTSKKTEMLARVFDHCTMKYKKGFRMLTLGWSDGNSFVPINHCLLSAAKDGNLLYEGKSYDGRSLAGRRRSQSREKATDVMLELLQNAVKVGHTAKYVLFDSWFSSPKSICNIKNDIQLDVIAMVKITSKVFYEYQGENLSVKEIYAKCKKRRGRSRYLLSVDVMVGNGKNQIPAKIVCVRNRSNRKNWLAIISTDISLTEEEIIQLYGKRWDIEVFFKVCKSYLQLIKGTKTTSYDALNSHIAIVFSRYMILSVNQRCNKDERTICELFYILANELADITFNNSLAIIMQALIETAIEHFRISEEQLTEFTSSFISKLPKYIRDTLQDSN